MCTVYYNAGFGQHGFVFWRFPLTTGGRSVGALHQRMIDDLIFDLVTNRLLILRDTIVLIFHHSIISGGLARLLRRVHGAGRKGLFDFAAFRIGRLMPLHQSIAAEMLRCSIDTMGQNRSLPEGK